MKKVKKRLLNLVVSIILIIVFGPLFLLFVYLGPVGRFCGQQQVERMLIRLLCDTDHQQLLHACRGLSKQIETGDLKPRKYWIRFDPDPESLTLPKSILELRPTSVFIDDDGRVMIEMLGGIFGHFGVKAYPENYKEPFSGFTYSDVKIIDGLWYYDDDCHRDEEHKKMIQSLIQRGK